MLVFCVMRKCFYTEVFRKRVWYDIVLYDMLSAPCANGTCLIDLIMNDICILFSLLIKRNFVAGW